jgi:hypothetical protein
LLDRELDRDKTRAVRLQSGFNRACFPVEDPVEEPPNTVEALVRRVSDQGFLVEGAGFEPATFGL